MRRRSVRPRSRRSGGPALRPGDTLSNAELVAAALGSPAARTRSAITARGQDQPPARGNGSPVSDDRPAGRRSPASIASPSPDRNRASGGRQSAAVMGAPFGRPLVRAPAVPSDQSRRRCARPSAATRGPCDRPARAGRSGADRTGRLPSTRAARPCRPIRSGSVGVRDGLPPTLLGDLGRTGSAQGREAVQVCEGDDGRNGHQAAPGSQTRSMSPTLLSTYAAPSADRSGSHDAAELDGA